MHLPMHRRTFLRASGITLALPFLESMGRAASAAAQTEPPRRLLLIGTPFGFDPVSLIPPKAGRDYPLTSHLEHLKDHRDDFTLITGISHPFVTGAHETERVLLTGAPMDGAQNLRNTISLDQEFAGHMRGKTRYSSLVLSTGGPTTHSPSLSYTPNGVPIPAIESPSDIFARLFLDSTPQQAAMELEHISEGRSMLDFVGEQAKRLSRRVSANDRARLDEYFDSVRDVEQQLQMSREWASRPKPKPMGKAPKDIDGPGQQPSKLQLMFDIVHLALVTDSTRSISLRTFTEHHNLTHHGQEPEKLAELRKTEVELLTVFNGLLTKLKSSKEGAGQAMLDNTMVLLTSNMRDGNTHRAYDLPAILAGGGFKHGQHLAFNPRLLETLDEAKLPEITRRPQIGANQAPLCNLYVSLLQRGGVETDRFGSSKGTLTGLELA
ncbi:DUF1552 domain-containing protein [Prosthecobacter sp.]|uniref:DUF1552 domain-containing protein n=1 Tax=Prosthecobacter sp. TaxID=1965333 RepID=UPI003783FF98